MPFVWQDESTKPMFSGLMSICQSRATKNRAAGHITGASDARPDGGLNPVAEGYWKCDKTVPYTSISKPMPCWVVRPFSILVHFFLYTDSHVDSPFLGMKRDSNATEWMLCFPFMVPFFSGSSSLLGIHHIRSQPLNVGIAIITIINPNHSVSPPIHTSSNFE